MMHFENSIVIVQVMNCFAVTITKANEDLMIKQAKSVMKEANRIQNEDPLLDSLKGNHLEELPELSIESILPVNRNVYLFKTWPEVVKFIQSIEGA